ncbi:DUF3558 domain-containing protein [Actinosynnema sp. ALI-1.44]|uniref:DUF3558 domain-containing protein n=1 Tax=Actinosynnema sp. ALI-1.44 TaxID=1933779 RepID=UPI0022A9130F|nr:DUF3558 domain-containing protein [Actinosynnema sp. ALI-1.44]
MTLAVLAGCSQKEPGVATGPSTEPEQTSTSKRPTSTPSSGVAGDKIDPCSLFPDADAERLGLSTPGKARTGNFGIPECRWTASGKFIAAVSSANNGLAKFKGEPVTLPKHKALQIVDLAEFRGCSIALEMSADLIYVANVSPADNTPGAQMCPHALEIAKVVDSKLP